VLRNGSLTSTVPRASHPCYLKGHEDGVSVSREHQEAARQQTQRKAEPEKQLSRETPRWESAVHRNFAEKQVARACDRWCGGWRTQ
jgi:hypothetical protein